MEGSGWLRETLDAMASDLGGRTIEIEPADRPLYHASAVMSCGALVALLLSAASLWQKMGVDEETASSSHYPPRPNHPGERGGPRPRSGRHRPRGEGRRGHTAPTPGGPYKPAHQNFFPLYIALTRASIPLTSALDRQKLRELETLLGGIRRISPPADTCRLPCTSEDERTFRIRERLQRRRPVSCLE